MKKIFLVKKDPKAINSPENWNILSSVEFKRFVETEDGKRRRPNFATLNALGPGDSMVIIECDEEIAKSMKKQHDLESAKQKAAAAIGMDTVSLHAIIMNGEYLDGAELLVDDECDIENMVIRKLQIEEMLFALGMLSEDDKDLIEALYLKGTHTEKSYGEEHGVSQQYIHKRKIRILQKLRELLDEK